VQQTKAKVQLYNILNRSLIKFYYEKNVSRKEDRERHRQLKSDYLIFLTNNSNTIMIQIFLFLTGR